MTREELVLKVTSYIEGSEGGSNPIPFSQRGMDRFHLLTDRVLVQLFSQAREQLLSQGIQSEPLIDRYHYPPYAALCLKAPFRVALVWQSESPDWINFAVIQERLFSEPAVKALHYNAILRGKLAQDLSFALLDVDHFIS